MKKFPRGVLLYLTNACNLNCTHCGIVNNEHPKYMSKECFYEVMDVLKQKKCFIVAISGGDPILHPYLFDYIKHIRESKMLPVLGLSGVGISDENILKLAEAGLGCIQVSLDGSNEEKNKIFRGENSFSEIINNIRRFNRYGIRTNLAICLCKENLSDFPALLELAHKENVYQLKVQFWESSEKNSNFTELSFEERNEVKRIAEDYVYENNLYDWLMMDVNYSSDEDLVDKFLVLPNGDVKSSETREPIGNILSQKEEILRQYE